MFIFLLLFSDRFPLSQLRCNNGWFISIKAREFTSNISSLLAQFCLHWSVKGAGAQPLLVSVCPYQQQQHMGTAGALSQWWILHLATTSLCFNNHNIFVESNGHLLPAHQCILSFNFGENYTKKSEEYFKPLTVHKLLFLNIDIKHILQKLHSLSHHQISRFVENSQACIVSWYSKLVNP